MAARKESFLSLALAKSRTSSELSTSSEEDARIPQMQHQRSLENPRLEADRGGWREIHGFRGNRHWNSPCQVMNEGDAPIGTASPSRKRIAHYEDEPYVFHQKIKILASMISDSRCCCVYSGKYLATTTELSSNTRSYPQKLISKIATHPTLTHHAITALYNFGHVHYWIQQHHDDGLPQKSGFPQEKLNEIHGSHYDPSNPVVGDEGTLRSDLFENLRAWENTTDLSLCIGTSKSGGMRSDSVFRAVCQRSRQGTAIGGVVIDTRKSGDEFGAALKIYANSDHVMEALLTQLCMIHVLPNVITSDQELMKLHSWSLPETCLTGEGDVFLFPLYNRRANRLQNDLSLNRLFTEINELPQHEPQMDEEGVIKDCLRLDLRVGAKVIIRGGEREGAVGEVLEKTHQGHYRFIFKTVAPPLNSPSSVIPTSASRQSDWKFRRILSDGSVGSDSSSGSEGFKITPGRKLLVGRNEGDTFEALLGVWWLQSAARGAVVSLPVINIDDEF